jgi:hypothetical protein
MAREHKVVQRDGDRDIHTAGFGGPGMAGSASRTDGPDAQPGTAHPRLLCLFHQADVFLRRHDR